MIVDPSAEFRQIEAQARREYEAMRTELKAARTKYQATVIRAWSERCKKVRALERERL